MTEHGAKLLQDSEDASFACGEWDRNDSDEPYDGVYARGAAAHDALAAYIEGLEAASAVMLEALREALAFFNTTRAGREYRDAGGAEPELIRAAIAKAVTP